MSKKQTLSPYQRRKLKEEKLKRLERASKLTTDLLFGPQKRFAESRAKRVAGSCSRRAGKSYGIAYKLVDWGMKWPNAIVPYITLTRESGRLIIHAPIRELCEAANIPIKISGNTGDVKLPNGSTIILRGCEDQREVEKLRGPKYPGAVIDEAQGIPSHLRYMIDEVLSPALMDYPDSQIYLTGTPNAACAGVFYDAVHGNFGDWENHHWIAAQNTSYAARGIDVEAYLEEERINRGLSVDDPAFLREFRGLWVKDTESQVYKYKPERNDIRWEEWRSLRDSVNDWEYVMGLDLGWNDPSALVVCAFSPTAGRFVAVASYTASEMSTDEIARHIRGYQDIYGEMPIIADSGGYGKSIAEALGTEYGFGVIPAQKQNKATYIEFLNNDLRSGAVRVLQPDNETLAECLSLLQWSDKHAEKGKPVEDKRSAPNHLTDAILYANRYAWHNDGVHVEQEPEFLSPEWFKRQEEEKIRAIEEQFRLRNAPEDDYEGQEYVLDQLLHS